MTASDDIAARFETERPRLRAVAAGILGSVHEADDAVQEAWFRLDRTNPADIANLSAWLTVVVSRISLDHIRARSSRREVPIDTPAAVSIATEASAESAILFEESVYDALNHAIDRLSPLETAAFILHDLFRLPFEEIAAIIDRSPQATRKLGSRARQKVSAGEAPPYAVERSHHAVIEAFLHAALSGNLDRLIATLAPNAVLRADAATQQLGSSAELVGAGNVAGQFSGRSQAARLVWIDGAPGAAWIHRGEVKVAFVFSINDDGVIESIWLRSNPDFLETTDFEIEPPQKKRNTRE
ncbi:MAG: sigma-70 family RNA polymerase sigma factor [Thermomicrobiales bacterium]|nr:sigma-70 family RNA polymerase sigma factor [Thermomicrobiales bacterium]